MIETGIIASDARVELLAGFVTEKMSKNPLHAAFTTILNRLFILLLPPNWIIRKEDPIVLEESMPEPDIAILDGRKINQLAEHPQPKHIALLVEVADSTLAKDQTVKKALYAQANIPVYWIINLPDQLIEVYRHPLRTGDYGQRETYRFDQPVPIELVGEIIANLELAPYLDGLN